MINMDLSSLAPSTMLSPHHSAPHVVRLGEESNYMFDNYSIPLNQQELDPQTSILAGLANHLLEKKMKPPEWIPRENFGFDTLTPGARA